MREIDFALPRIEQLERAVANATRLLPPHSLALIRDLFMVMKQERKAIQDNKGECRRKGRLDLTDISRVEARGIMMRSHIIICRHSRYPCQDAQSSSAPRRR